MTRITCKEHSNETSAARGAVIEKQDTLNRRELTLGLVPSPELGERLASSISDDLPAFLSDHVDDRVCWNVRMVTDPLAGSKLEAPDLLNEVHKRLQAGGWDYAVCLTDLPIRRDGQIVIADASTRRSIAWISIPPVGVVRRRDRIRTAILQLMREMHGGEAHSEIHRQRRYDGGVPDEPGQRDPAVHQLTGSGIARRITPPDDQMDVDVRYVASRVTGHARLLAGMVHANTPWTLFPAFKKTIATAFATGAYGLIFTTLWEVGDAYGIARLVTLMIMAMAILITWIAIAHNLWETQADDGSSYLKILYNSATVLTITTGVIFAYVIIFIMIFLAGMIFIPDSMLESTLQHPTTPMNYLKIAWVTASVATIAGAVGAGLEDTEAVRNATFNYRQQQRFEEYEDGNG